MRGSTRSNSSSAHPTSTGDSIVQDYPVPAYRGTTRQHSAEWHDRAAQNTRERSTEGNRLPSAFSLAGKTCVVIGGARGTGRLLSDTVVQAGGSLIIVDIDEDASKKTLNEIQQKLLSGSDGEDVISAKKQGIQLASYKCDACDEDEVSRTFQNITRDLGRIHVLTKSTGIFHQAPRQLSQGSIRSSSPFSMDVETGLYGAREAAKLMQKNKDGGSIVFISDAHQTRSLRSRSTNTSSISAVASLETMQAASTHLALSLAREWAPLGVRVNSIIQGSVALAHSKTESDLVRDRLIPAGRLCQPHDLKGPFLYLASRASSFVTGTDLRVDGGAGIL